MGVGFLVERRVFTEIKHKIKIEGNISERRKIYYTNSGSPGVYSQKIIKINVD